MCTRDVTGRLYTAVISRNWAKNLCISHLCSRVQPQHAKSNTCFAIVSLIAGFALLQIFAGKPNNSSSRTKHFASFLLGFDFPFFPSFFLSPHHSWKPADRDRSRLILHIWSSQGLLLQKSKLLEGFHHSWGSRVECICVVRGFWLRKKKVQFPDLCTCSSPQATLVQISKLLAWHGLNLGAGFWWQERKCK